MSARMILHEDSNDANNAGDKHTGATVDTEGTRPPSTNQDVRWRQAEHAGIDPRYLDSPQFPQGYGCRRLVC
jgi:hypothetical protein